jgi:redox-sensitive bicupin YhaK (pirin superfamily)
LLEGFQLWINLPAANKMDPAAYQEYSSRQNPVEGRAGDVQARVIAGTTSRGTRGPVIQPLTDPLYLDVRIPPGESFAETLFEGYNAFVFTIEGDSVIGGYVLKREQLAILEHGEALTVRAGDEGTRFLLVAGRPLREAIARGGPLVMNTRDEIRQAFADYDNGTLV